MSQIVTEWEIEGVKLVMGRVDHEKTPIHSGWLFCCCYSLEHVLHSNDGVAVGQRVLLSWIGQLLIDNHYILCQVDSRPQQVVQTVDRTEHPINLQTKRWMDNGIPLHPVLCSSSSPPHAIGGWESVCVCPVLIPWLLLPRGNTRLHRERPHPVAAPAAGWWDWGRSLSESAPSAGW